MNLGPSAGMHPVEQAIRVYVTGDPDICDSAKAVLAVLDLHKPEPDDPNLCGCCFNAIEQQYEYPCPTVKAIAAALGVTP